MRYFFVWLPWLCLCCSSALAQVAAETTVNKDGSTVMTFYEVVPGQPLPQFEVKPASLSQSEITPPPENMVTPDWLYARPQQTKIMVIVPSDFSAPPRLLLGDPKYLNEYCVHGSPSWSADGTRLAFNVQKPSETLVQARMVSVKLDGSDAKDLGLGLMPNFSADGKQLTYCGYEALGRCCLMNHDGTNKRVIPNSEDGWGPQWSPDGRFIAFHRLGSPPQVALHDVETNTTRDLIPRDANIYQNMFWNMAWSPDSKRIAFLAKRGSENYSAEDYKAQIGLLTVDDPIQLTPFPSTQLAQPHVDFSRDGTFLLYPQDGCLLKINVDDPAGEPTPLPRQFTDFGYGSAAFSPDGRWIAVHLY